MNFSEDPKQNLKILREASRRSFPNNPTLADLCFAQAILEGRARGKPTFTPSGLAGKYFNLFGMKPGHLIPKGTAKGNGIVYLDTDEYTDGKLQHLAQPFLSNLCIEDSFEQHKKLLTDLPRYAKVIQTKTFETAALEIWKAGYATNPQYVHELLDMYKVYIKGKYE